MPHDVDVNESDDRDGVDCWLLGDNEEVDEIAEQK